MNEDLDELPELEPLTPEEAKRCRDSEDEYDFDAKAEDVAKKRGQKVVYPESNQLQIDIDSEKDWNTFLERCDWFEINHDWIEEHASASGLPNRHATITHPKRTFTEAERIAYQFALGSDPVREKLNSIRLWTGTKRPTRLFEKK